MADFSSGVEPTIDAGQLQKSTCHYISQLELELTFPVWRSHLHTLSRLQTPRSDIRSSSILPRSLPPLHRIPYRSFGRKTCQKQRR